VPVALLHGVKIDRRLVIVLPARRHQAYVLRSLASFSRDASGSRLQSKTAQTRAIMRS
jgi:hypothetical protein